MAEFGSLVEATDRHWGSKNFRATLALAILVYHCERVIFVFWRTGPSWLLVLERNPRGIEVAPFRDLVILVASGSIFPGCY